MAVWLPKTVDLAHVPLPPTLASSSRASSSYCWPPDSVTAVNDQAEPADSNDQSIPRLTWWDHKGTAEWVAYEFAKPASVRAVRVAWFDDTGSGECRLPVSWRILYRASDGQWQPVTGASDYLIRKGEPVKVTFAPVTTQALRLEAQLPKDFSAGLYELEVE